MRRLFQRDKPHKLTKGATSRDLGEATPLTFSEHALHSHVPRSTHDSQSSIDEQWQVVPDSGAYEDYPVHLRPPSAASSLVPSRARDRDVPAVRQKPLPSPTTPAAVGILSALDPSHPKLYIDEGTEPRFPPEEKKEKKPFNVWGKPKESKDKLKERERERERGRESEKGGMNRHRDNERAGDIARLITHYANVRAEDWAFALEICERVDASESNAKEAISTLRKELKHGEPAIQLSVARLWAIMLRNCQETFILSSMSRKFLDTLEETITSSRTSPVARDRLLEYLAGATYEQRLRGLRSDKEGFSPLWRRLKSVDQPEDGIPLNIADGLPPGPSSDHASSTEGSPRVTVGYHDQTGQNTPDSPVLVDHRGLSTRNRIIPPDEDMRRLFQECRIAEGNASFLSSALVHTKPEDLRTGITREFYLKCQASQELIHAQIPWATASAERSRAEKNKTKPKRNDSYPQPLSLPGHDRVNVETTQEEQLLAALLSANEKLLEAFKVHHDMERISSEPGNFQTETRSTQTQLQHKNESPVPSDHHVRVHDRSSRSPSPVRSLSSASPPITYRVRQASHDPNITEPIGVQDVPQPAQGPPPFTVLFSPPAPHGPRSLTPSSISRTSSMNKPNARTVSLDENRNSSPIGFPQNENSEEIPKPSAKALGKRKVILAEIDTTVEHGSLADGAADTFSMSSSDLGTRAPWNNRVQYVYDAAAERTQERLKAGHSPALVNGVH